MPVFSNTKYNPNPITKLLSVILLGFTVIHSMSYYFEWLAILLISIFFYLNGLKKDAIKNIFVYLILFNAPNFEGLAKLPILLKMFLSLIFVIRMFYLPFIAGKFLIKTSDVGSIISSMDKIQVPSCISIPIAVMFRFFPSFKEEKDNIKLAMKVRGISIKNPIAYIEYVIVPLLIVSSNISEDISKAAETKCIENPIKKVRYTYVGLKVIDLIYGGLILLIVIGGQIC